MKQNIENMIAENQALLEIIEKIPAVDFECLYIGIEDDAQKASYIMQEVTEDYFNTYDPDKDFWQIKADFHRMSVFCNVVADYIFEIQKQAKELKDISQELFYIREAAKSLIIDRQV